MQLQHDRLNQAALPPGGGFFMFGMVGFSCTGLFLFQYNGSRTLGKISALFMQN